MKKILCSLIPALLLIVVFAQSAFADVPEPHADFYYLDEVGVLSSETKSMLYTNGEALKKACGAQIVVCVVDSFGRMSDEDFAYELINKWGVGDKDKKNGVALVIAEGDGLYRMVIGTGLERYMDGADVQALLDDYFHPYFKDYKTDRGVQALYAPLFKKICSIYDVNLSLVTGSALPDEKIIYDDDYAAGYEEDDGGLSFGAIFMIVLVIIIIIVIVNRRRGPASVPGPGTGGASVPGGRTRRPIIVFNRPHFGGHRGSHHGGFGGFGGSFGSNRPSGGSFGSSRSGGSSGRTRSSGRSGGFGGARGGGGGSRGVGGGGRR